MKAALVALSLLMVSLAAKPALADEFYRPCGPVYFHRGHFGRELARERALERYRIFTARERFARARWHDRFDRW